MPHYDCTGMGRDLTFSKNECPTARAILTSQNASTELVNITFFQYISRNAHINFAQHLVFQLEVAKGACHSNGGVLVSS